MILLSAAIGRMLSVHYLVPCRFPRDFPFVPLQIRQRLKRTKKSSPVSRSGRFAGGPAADVAAFSESISFDWRLWEQDIRGSLAHAAMLQRIGVLTRSELNAIRRGLEGIRRDIAAGRFPWKAELEDVHMNIEAELTRRVPAGAKLHTGRSRNDQVALDLRLWLREQIVALAGELRDLQSALVSLGARHADVLIPGYTHLQRAQPVYFAHHLLAYVEMFERDLQRLGGCFQRVNVCPLGSGALAGSTLPLDREYVAKLLDFTDRNRRPQITQNSMDAVSDRDFLIEFCGLFISRDWPRILCSGPAANSISSGSRTPTPRAVRSCRRRKILMWRN